MNPFSPSATSAAWRTDRRAGRPSQPASRRHRSKRPPFAGTRGRNRGCCRRDAQGSFRRSRHPEAGNHCQRRHRQASASAGGPRRQKQAAERSRAWLRHRRARWRLGSRAPAGSASISRYRGSSWQPSQFSKRQRPDAGRTTLEVLIEQAKARCQSTSKLTGTVNGAGRAEPRARSEGRPRPSQSQRSPKHRSRPALSARPRPSGKRVSPVYRS